MAGISKAERMRRNRKNAGRPSVFTVEVIGKIEEAAAYDATIEEMAYYAGIKRDTLYKKLQTDEAFFQRIEALRNRPILKARKTIIDGLAMPDNAKWYLERKKKLEFSARQELEANVSLNISQLLDQAETDEK